MEGRTKPDMYSKKTNMLMFVTFSLALVYVFIAFRNNVQCVDTRNGKPDAYQDDKDLRVDVMFNQFRHEFTEDDVRSRQVVKNTPVGQGSPGVVPQQYQCTVSDVQRRAGTVLLTTTNAAYLDFTVNWLESIERTRACPNISVITEDEEAFSYLSQKTMTGLNVLKTHTEMSSTGKLVFDTKEYKKFVNKRQGYILDRLERGWEVLFSDVDTFWLRDPFPFFQGNFDMALEEDIHEPAAYCAGFVYYRPTERTLKFVREWIRFMANDKTMKPDQIVMNMLIRRKAIPGLKLRVLNSNQFPNGKLFFNEEWRRDKRDIVVVHNNWIVGHDPKVERFRNSSMWLVDDNTDFMST